MSDPQAQSMIFDNLRRNISNVGGLILQKKLKEQETKQALQDKIKAALIEGVIGGKVQAKPGVDLSGLNNMNTEDIGSTLGVLGKNFQPVKTPAMTTSINYSPVPFSDIKSAGDVLTRTPQDYMKAGMATPDPQEMSILGFKTGRKKGTGLLGLGYGPGSQNAVPVLSPEAIAIQKAAKNVVNNPVRKTVSQKGAGAMFTGQPEGLTSGGGDEVSAMIQSLKDQGHSEDEIKQALTDAGYDPGDYGL